MFLIQPSFVILGSTQQNATECDDRLTMPSTLGSKGSQPPGYICIDNEVKLSYKLSARIFSYKVQMLYIEAYYCLIT